MNQQEATTAWLSGSPILMVEYRSSIAEVIPFRDKTSGRMEKMQKITHNVELGALSLPVSERVPDGTALEPATYKAPFQKGQKCILHLDSMMRDKGAWKCSGSLEPIQVNGKP